MKKIKQKIKNWLGIMKMENKISLYESQLKEWGMLGIDLGIREESTIVIASRAQGGVVKVIRCKFDNLQEAKQLAKDLENRYGIKKVIEDHPRWI